MTRRRWQLITLIILFCLSVITTPVMAQMRQSTTGVHVQSQLTTQDLVQQAQAFYRSGEFEQAAEIWQQAVAVFQASGDRLNQVMALNNLSLTYQQLGQWAAAQNAIIASLELLDSITPTPDKNQPYLLAQTLNIQGNLQLETGDAKSALETWKQATKIYTEISYTEGILQSQVNQAEALQDLGLNPRACQTLLLAIGFKNQQCKAEGVPRIPQENFDVILNKIKTKSISQSKILAIVNLGNVLKNLGQLQQSQALFLAILEQDVLQNPEDVSQLYLKLGSLYRELEELSQAWEYYQQATQFSTLPLSQFQAKLEQLNILIEIDKWERAPALIQKLQSIINQLSFSQIEIETRIYYVNNLLKFLESQGKNQENNQNIETEIEQLISLIKTQSKTKGDVRGLAYALGLEGKLYEYQQQWNLAEELTLLSLQTISADDHPEILYQLLWQLGRIDKRQGKTDEAIKIYRQTVDLLEYLRQDLVAISSEARYNFRENIEPIYRELVDLLLPPGIEVNQSRLNQARETIEALQLAELNNFFRDSCLEVQSRKVETVDKDAAVIYSIILSEGLVTSERLVTIISIPGQPLKKYEVPITQKQIQTVNNQFTNLINPAFPAERILRPAQEIYNWLVQPLEKTLEENHVDTLVFVLDGFLRNLPMAALYDGEQFLLEKYNIALSTGLQLFDSKPLNYQDMEIMIGGITEARQNFSPLPSVKIEVEQIANKVRSNILFNQTFTKEKLEQKFNQLPFPVIHLATHGQFSSNQAETFLLTWDDKIRIQDLKQLLDTRTKQGLTPVELLVLSACQTAKGDDRAALGLAGLAVRSGARTTVATLWSVNDQSTTALMIEFYQQLLAQPKVSKAEALRQSQLKLLQSSKYQHPYYWAAFVMIGNWL